MIKSFITILFSLLFVIPSFAFEDPTQGEPFLPWVWEEQLKPTAKNLVEPDGLWILASGATMTAFASRYDQDVRENVVREKNLLMDKKTARGISAFGSGFVGVGIAATQLYFDTPNGLLHTRAIAFTSISHFLMAATVQRKRPGNTGKVLPFDASFPSGHTSSAFATATSLAYAYGWKAGVPAFLAATAIGASRVHADDHWTSDVVAGATLGIMWGRASYLTSLEKDKSVQWAPVPTEDGMQIVFYKSFP